MSYKTILIHCNDQRRLPRLLAPTIAFADRFQSHVIGLSVSTADIGHYDRSHRRASDHCRCSLRTLSAGKFRYAAAIQGSD